MAARSSRRAQISPLQAFVFCRYLFHTCVKRQKLTWDCRVASSEYIDSILFFIWVRSPILFRDFSKGSGSRRVSGPNFFSLKSLKYCSFINGLIIHFGHNMYIECRLLFLSPLPTLRPLYALLNCNFNQLSMIPYILEYKRHGQSVHASRLVS